MNKLSKGLLYSSVILMLGGLILFVTGAALGRDDPASFPLMTAGSITFILGLIDIVCFLFYRLRIKEKEKKENDKIGRD